MPATVTTNIGTWRDVRIGGGGYVTAMRHHADGTLICRTDTAGAWKFSGAHASGSWSNITNATSLPNTADRYGGGVFELAIAPSNSSIFYAAYGDKFYKSANAGDLWTRQGTFTKSMPGNDGQRQLGSKIAVDPLNADVVYLGTPDGVLQVSTNGGVNWADDATVNGASTYSGSPVGINPVLIDPTSTNIGGRSSTVWCFGSGVGAFRSTDGGASFAAVAGGPSGVCMHGCFASDGTLYVTEWDGANANLWKYNGTWTQLSPTLQQGSFSVACDPNSVNRIVVCSFGGNMQQSLDAGSSWSVDYNYSAGKLFHTSANFPWMVQYEVENALSNADVIFSNVAGDTNKLLISEGIGAWYETLATNATSMTYKEMTLGIENLVLNTVSALPNGALWLTSHDRASWKITNPETYSAVFVFPAGASFAHGNSTHYLSSDNNVIGVGTQQYGGHISTDGGTTLTSVVRPSFIAALDYSGFHEILPLSSTVYLGIPDSANRPCKSTDLGQTWAKMSFPGIPDDTTDAGNRGFGNYYYIDRRNLAPDRVTAGTVYIFHTNGNLGTTKVFKSTDYGDNWTLQFSGILVAFPGFHNKMKSPEGFAGHLWFSNGFQVASGNGNFVRSVDGGVTWTTIADVQEVIDWGWGAKRNGSQVYLTLWIIAWVNGVLGIYYSTDVSLTPASSSASATGAFPTESFSWTKVGAAPLGNRIEFYDCIDGDKNVFGKAYVGFAGSGAAYINQNGMWTLTTSKT